MCTVSCRRLLTPKEPMPSFSPPCSFPWPPLPDLTRPSRLFPSWTWLSPCALLVSRVDTLVATALLAGANNRCRLQLHRRALRAQRLLSVCSHAHLLGTAFNQLLLLQLMSMLLPPSYLLPAARQSSPRVPMAKHAAYKYLLHVDGQALSSRCEHGPGLSANL